MTRARPVPIRAPERRCVPRCRGRSRRMRPRIVHGGAAEVLDDAGRTAPVLEVLSEDGVGWLALAVEPEAVQFFAQPFTYQVEDAASGSAAWRWPPHHLRALRAALHHDLQVAGHATVAALGVGRDFGVDQRAAYHGRDAVVSGGRCCSGGCAPRGACRARTVRCAANPAGHGWRDGRAGESRSWPQRSPAHLAAAVLRPAHAGRRVSRARGPVRRSATAAARRTVRARGHCRDAHPRNSTRAALRPAVPLMPPPPCRPEPQRYRPSIGVR